MRRLALIAVLGAGAVWAQSVPDDPVETRRAMAEASQQANAARARAERLEAEAANASAAADRTARETAAVAARVQQSEAEIAASEQRIRLIAGQRAALRGQMAQHQRPLVRLTAALQQLSRRPPVLSLLRPGSLADAVHQRALLESMLPEVQKRTAALRGELARARRLEQQARNAEAAMRSQKQKLDEHRAALVTLEQQQRMAARTVSGSASREAERALALAEQARDLGSLVGELEQAAALRDQLARLPGPVLRPARPDQSQASNTAETGETGRQLAHFTLPVDGRLVSGFGGAAHGIGIAARAQAQVVAPADGRVVFADTYPGYGQIVIVEHDGGWTSVVTGMARLDVRVGDKVLAGGPLGQMGAGRPVLSFELRKDAQPVNPLDQLRGRS